MHNSFFILIFLFLGFASCKKTQNPGSEIPTGFSEFYEKFHEDSLYQLAHIRFPLEGMPTVNDNSIPQDFHWEANKWEMHKPFKDDGTDFKRELNVVDSTIVIETIRMRSNEYGMERRFAKFGNDWQLIYYASMNKLVKNRDIDTSLIEE